MHGISVVESISRVVTVPCNGAFVADNPQDPWQGNEQQHHHHHRVIHKGQFIWDAALAQIIFSVAQATDGAHGPENGDGII